ncbi:MAG TPA: porphobilinogen synthase [Candidatus Limnocylindria bacterium]|nr:porphobilinogen synthase [Candidatus Limnocylindria bacterium]
MRSSVADPVTFDRHRRLRRGAALRSLVREHRIDPRSLILPVFFDARISEPEPISSLSGHSRWPTRDAVRVAERAAAAGIGGLLLFGLPDAKDEEGSGARDPLGPVPDALRRIRDAGTALALIADVCLCEYTSHGHCGVLTPNGAVDNDATLPLLADAAAAYAEAGADIVAPSDMMDGRVAAIRSGLDRRGHETTAILAYSAKYASAFYGPFREAADCAPREGDRSGYQMDPPNGREALAEMASDLAEGADMLMVKPAGPYLDVLARARERFDVPLAAYQVSGEYAAICAAAERGWLDRDRAARESLVGIVRAGADVVITYFALEAAAWS